MMPRWPHTAEKSVGWRTSSMASSSITSRGNLNEAIDTLAKAASDLEPVPMGIFASN